MQYYFNEVRESVTSAWLWVLSILGAFGFLSAFNHVYEFDYFLQLATRLSQLSEFIWIRLLNIDIPNLIAEYLTILVLSVFLFLRGLFAKADSATKWISHLPTRHDERNFRITLACFVAMLVVVFFYVSEQIWRGAGIEAGLTDPAAVTLERVLITLAALAIVSVCFLLLFYFPRILLSAVIAGGILIGADRALDTFAEEILTEAGLPAVGRTVVAGSPDDPLTGDALIQGYIGNELATGRFYTTTNARLRADPNLNADQLRVLRADRPVTVLGLSADQRWAAVEADDLTGSNRGYVHVTLLRI